MSKSGLILSFTLINVAFAQKPAQLSLPPIERGESAKATEKKIDPVSSYNTPHEAALAALQAGYKAFTLERNPDRAVRYFLVSLRRDPLVALTLYNMGVLCAQQERWTDALNFLQAANRVLTTLAPPDAALAKLTAAEIERVQVIEQLERTLDGRKRRRYDLRLMEVIKLSEPFAALTAIGELAKIDPSRWESFAISGIMHAKAGAFPESLKALQSAARLAPPMRKPNLQSAAELARREASFSEQVRTADELWEKQQYDSAAKLYVKAWEDSPGHLDVAMEAATGFLLSDQVPPAVVVLAQLRDSRSDELSSKCVAMLKQLGAISEDAKNEAGRARAVPPAAQSGDIAERIANLVGQLTTPLMELAAKPNPPLIQDKTSFAYVDDEDLTAGSKDTILLSTQSIYAVYERERASRVAQPPVETLPAGTVPPLAETPPAAIAVPQLLLPTSEPRPTRRVPVPPSFPGTQPPHASGVPPPLSLPAEAQPVPATPKTDEAALASILAPRAIPLRGTQKEVSARFVSSPTGASVLFDGMPSTTCKTPCETTFDQGRHTLVAKLPGFRDALGIVIVENKPFVQEIKLVMKIGRLSVTSTAPGAPIFLNGVDTNMKTPYDFLLPEDIYDVGVQVKGEMLKKRVEILDESLQKLSF